QIFRLRLRLPVFQSYSNCSNASKLFVKHKVFYLKSDKSSSPVRKPLGANGFLPINPSSLSCQNLISVSPSFQQSQTSWSNLIQGKSSKPSSTLLIIIPISSSSSMDLYRFDTAPFNCCFFLMKLSSEDPDSTVFCNSSCNKTTLFF